MNNNKIPDGYTFGSMLASVGTMDRNKPLICDVCKRPKMGLTRMEKDYPNNPDLHVCQTCILEAELLRGDQY